MTSVPSEEGVPFGTKIHDVATKDPDGVGVIFAAEDGSERAVTWRQLDERSTQLARVLAERGLGVGEYLAVCLRNSPEHLMACFAGWKVGAVIVPMRWDLPNWERGRILDVVAPRLVVDAEHADLFDESLSASTEPLPEVVSPHGWAMCSSGSTGTPKVIVVNNPGLYLEGPGTSTVVETFGPLPQPQRVLVPAPLYHTNGFTTFRSLMSGVQVVLLERFNAPRILDLIEEHRITGFIAATPMLQRLAQVPGIEQRDLSSIDWVQQGASPLPIWLGRRWCELVGAEHFYLSYGATEGHGLAVCRGDEWLEHPGTLGRGFMETEIEILDADGNELPPGRVGSIYMRTPTGPGASYVGDNVPPMPRTDDGFVTVGDMGWLDEEGFLYMADRRVDMIVTGAVNVFPAEVESALSEHPGIVDVVVVGLRDPEWGRRVHAIVQAEDPSHPPEVDEVIVFAKERLAPYKVPKTVEFVSTLPRSDAMKLSRAALVAERDGPESDAGSPG
ncbi:MAG TPA: AMP-binding protein [Acidimicrobiales bacterium]|nr:AMP-binding protein [Acidimicrobiales bacterium]